MSAFLEGVLLCANLMMILFVVFYVFRLRGKERALDTKEKSIDTNYHTVVDNALLKERKILEDATNEADQIIGEAQHVSHDTQAMVDQALKGMMHDIQQQAVHTAHAFTQSYQESLRQIATSSLTDFQTVAKNLEAEMEQQVRTFRETILPGMEKELEEYKKSRMKQTEQTISQIVQTVSQELLNKSLSLTDHQNLLIESLEKAKKKGLFD